MKKLLNSADFFFFSAINEKYYQNESFYELLKYYFKYLWVEIVKNKDFISKEIVLGFWEILQNNSIYKNMNKNGKIVGI